MRGRILGVDQRNGEGQISGDDGQRYVFGKGDWNRATGPVVGQMVDFQTSGERAVSVFSLTTPSPLSGDKNRIAAALLAFFLGGLGVHKFYLGRTGAGLIMLFCSLFGIILLFLPTLVIGIIAFVEFIIYLVTSDEDFERRYVVEKRSWF